MLVVITYQSSIFCILLAATTTTFCCLIYHLEQGGSEVKIVQDLRKFYLYSISWYDAFQVFLVKYCVVMIHQRK